MRVVSENFGATFAGDRQARGTPPERLLLAKLQRDLRCQFGLPTEALPARIAELVRKLEEH